MTSSVATSDISRPSKPASMKKPSTEGEAGSLDVSFDQSYPGSPVHKVKVPGTSGKPTCSYWTSPLLNKLPGVVHVHYSLLVPLPLNPSQGLLPLQRLRHKVSNPNGLRLSNCPRAAMAAVDPLRVTLPSRPSIAQFCKPTRCRKATRSRSSASRLAPPLPQLRRWPFPPLLPVSVPSTACPRASLHLIR